jgi:hypothetical protein
MKTVYFAGKVKKGGGYRGKLLGNSMVMSRGHEIYEVDGGKLIYGGPFALACDHGCYHGSGKHGLLDFSGGHGCAGQFVDSDGTEFLQGWKRGTADLDYDDAVLRCLVQIKNSDAVHCYIESISCYGTLVELGFAAAHGKPTYIYLKGEKHNWYKHYWFCMKLPNIKHCGSGTETSIHPDLLTKVKSHKELYYDYLQSPQWDSLRKAKLKEAGYRCQLCNANGKIAVHHRTYDRVFNELLSDLIALCDPCHEKFHGIGA